LRGSPTCLETSLVISNYSPGSSR